MKLQSSIVAFIFVIQFQKFLIRAFSIVPSSLALPVTLSSSRSSLHSIPSPFVSNQNSIEETSAELLNILVEQWKSVDDEARNIDDSIRIDNLIQALVESKTEFDPNECLFGNFFMTIYISGTTPLWEKLSRIPPSFLKSKRPKNVKGQKYYFDYESSSSSLSKTDQGRVINYAEVFGKAIHLRAYGKCTKKASTNEINPVPNTKETPSNPRNAFVAFIENQFGKQIRQEKSDMLKCPVDFIASVEKGTIVLFNNEIDIQIQGTGTVRVLYADPNLRVFVNVDDNTDPRWEKDGLCVVQVRANIVDSEWTL